MAYVNLPVLSVPEAVDLYAGAGGWDEAARWLGLTNVDGLEIDPVICQTARLAGHRRFQADIRHVSTEPFRGVRVGIASPVCPGFSNGGQRRGLDDRGRIIELGPQVAQGRPIPQDGWHDQRSALTLEPLRWAVDLLPDILAWEQVPAVFPLWEAFGAVLEGFGYDVRVVILDAKDYGGGQARRRAILLGRRDGGRIALPTPIERRVSMFDVLGWGMTDRVYPTLASARTTGGPDKEKVGGSGARAAIYAEREAGRWVHGGGCCCADPSSCGRKDLAPSVTPLPRRLSPAQQRDGSIRLSLAEAAMLQTFPANYPWSGTATDQFRQITNAVPVILGIQALRAVGIGAGVPVEDLSEDVLTRPRAYEGMPDPLADVTEPALFDL